MTTFRQAVDLKTAEAYRSAGWWGDVTLVDHVRTHAGSQPDSPAYIADEGSLTWAELDTASDRIGGVVCDLGIEAGARVAVLIPDNATVHAVYLGLEKAGVVVVGIGARAGDHEIAHLVSTAEVRILLTLGDHRGRPAPELRRALEELGLELAHHIEVPLFEKDVEAPIVVDGKTAAEPVPRTFDDRRIGPDDLFLINSTSGTTGLPKCVLHTQNRWLYFHQKAVEHGEIGENEVLLSAVPAPFGFGLWTSHFTPIVLGAPMVVSSRFDAAATLRLIDHHRVSIISCVSTQFLMMLNEPGFESHDLASLHSMFTGGEAVPEMRAREFEDRSGCSVLQFYGSNETGLLSGTRKTDSLRERLTTAGRIIPEMNVRLYDAEGEGLADGSEGRPACRGPGTCIGYLDPEANNDLFTDDGWMLMGDLCTIDDSGLLTVTGRISDFIIRGGKNISASQVEDEVNTHPVVGLSAAVAVPDDVFGERVCVYVELNTGDAELTLDDLLQHLEQRGTSKEIRPELLVVLDELPRSSGGKIAKGTIADDVSNRFAKN